MLKQFVVFYLLVNSLFVSGSPGDNLEEFEECNRACAVKNNCNGFGLNTLNAVNRFKYIHFNEVPIFYKTFLFWDCVSDCDYQCQQLVTEMRVDKEEEIFQFHGKWPFKRFFTMQEFFSTIFSIGNFFPHLHGLRRLNTAIKNYNSYQIRNTKRNVTVHLKNYTYVAMAGMFAWSASTIFHWRDLLITEHLDYFFAGMTVLMGFHAIFARITRLDKYPQYLDKFFWIVLAIFAAHVLRLYFDWSYTYNMRFNIFFGLLQYILLLVLAFRNYQGLKSNKVEDFNLLYKLCGIPLIMVVSTAMAMSLEIFDFFSWKFQIDAHAIWHFCTIWPSWLLYDFFINDFDYMTAKNNID